MNSGFKVKPLHLNQVYDLAMQVINSQLYIGLDLVLSSIAAYSTIGPLTHDGQFVRCPMNGVPIRYATY